MSRNFSEATWSDGDVLSPDEPNFELASIVGEMNGHIDGDNFPASEITGAKFALQTFHSILFIEGAGPTTVERTNADDQFWHSLEVGTLTTEDGRIKVQAEVTFDSPSGKGYYSEVGVRLDGRVVARSGPSSTYVESDTISCFGCPDVGPGVHNIELLFRIMPGLGWAASATVDINSRTLFARAIRR